MLIAVLDIFSKPYIETQIPQVLSHHPHGVLLVPPGTTNEFRGARDVIGPDFPMDLNATVSLL